MFNSIAKVKYDSENDILRAELFDDLVNYYKFLYLKDSYNVNKMWTARHGSHITIYSPAYHGKKEGAAKFDNQLVNFSYNPELIYQGGHKKGFIGFYVQIESPDIDWILEELNIEQKLHLSLFTNKWEKSQKKTS